MTALILECLESSSPLKTLHSVVVFGLLKKSSKCLSMLLFPLSMFISGCFKANKVLSFVSFTFHDRQECHEMSPSQRAYLALTIADNKKGNDDHCDAIE